MNRFDFYFDPVCPFAWAASRWLAEQAGGHDDSVDWHVMSLAVLNEDREPASDQQRRQWDTSRRLGRLFMAAIAKNGEDTIGSLYSVLGRRFHHEAAEMTSAVVSEILVEAGLRTELAEAMNDDSYDDALRAAHQRSQEALGEDGGSPITGINGTHFFGPVLSDIPTGDEAQALYSAIITLGTTPVFSQLKRPTSGRPVFQR